MYKVLKTSIYRKLTCLYVGPFIFLFTFSLKCPNKLHSVCILSQNFNSFNFAIWVAVGVVVVHAGLLAVSDCAMVRKVKVTNGMQEFRTEEDSLELRQVGSWQDQRGALVILALGIKFAC